MNRARTALLFVLPAIWAQACAGAISSQAVAALTKTASSDDPIASLAALHQLAESGDAGTAALRQIAPQLLTRDLTAVAAEADNAALSIPRLRGLENQMQPLRAGALQMIDSLREDPESLKSARAVYARIAALEARLSVEYARKGHVVSAVARQIECAKLQLSPLDANEHDRFEKSATQALAMPCALAAGFLSGPHRATGGGRSPRLVALCHQQAH